MITILMITQLLIFILLPIVYTLQEKRFRRLNDLFTILSKNQKDWIGKHQHWIEIFEKKHNDVPRYVQECIDLQMKKDKRDG